MDGSTLAGGSLAPHDWEQLIRVHRHSVRLSLLASGVRASRANELVHEAFAVLFEKWSGGRLDVLSLPGLAIAQAKFLALADGRRARAAGESLDGVDRADARATPEEQLGNRQLVEQLERALESCPARARELYTLAFQNPEAKHDELAERAGISVQRLRQTLCEVRSRLRAAVKESL